MRIKIFIKKYPNYMIRNYCISLIFISLFMGVTLADDGEYMEHLPQIIDRYRSMLLAENPPKENLVREWISDLSSDGTWPDIDYDDTSGSGWQPAVHIRRIRSMALAHSAPERFQHADTRLRTAIERALDHWCSQRYTASNWWWNEIGVPRAMRDIVILIGNDLGSERREAALSVIAQHRLRGAAANLMWSAELSLHHGCLTGNPDQVAMAVEKIWDGVRISPGESEGIKSDCSYFQHSARLQTFHYGKAYLDVVCKITWQLRDTPWAIPQEKRVIISNWLLDGVQWMCRGINTAPGTLDRAVSRRGTLRSADIKVLLEWWSHIEQERREEVEAFLNSQSKNTPSVTGYRHFPLADFTVYHRPGGSIFLKTVSSRTLLTEDINGENRKGVPYLHCGDFYIVRDGKEYSNMQPVWQWNQLPGLTIPDWKSSQERRDFVGGIGNGLSGMTAMDYVRSGGTDTLKVRKMWVFHDNMMICLLGGWESTEVSPKIITAVEQCRLRGPVYAGTGDTMVVELEDGEYHQTDTRWILHNEIGYAPLGAQLVSLYLGRVTGSWQSINRSYSAEKVSEPVLRILLRHGADPGPAGFVIVLGTDEKKLESITRNPGWEIVRNDMDCQCLRFGSENFFAAFYKPTSIDAQPDLTVSEPCLAMWTEEHLWLCDPTNQGAELMVIWKNRKYELGLPDGGKIKEIVASDAFRQF